MSREEFTCDAVETIYSNNNFSRDRYLYRQLLFGFSEVRAAIQCFAICSYRQGCARFSQVHKRENPSSQAQVLRSIGFPTIQTYVPFSKAAQNLEKKEQTLVCSSSPASFINVAVSDHLIWMFHLFLSATEVSF